MKYPKPFETPKYLNRLHPHAKGLKASYLFNGRAKSVFDCTRNGNNLSIVNATWESDPDIGRGLLFDADGEYASLDNTNQLVNSEEGTIVIWFKSLSSFSDGTHRFLFGKRNPVQEGYFGIFKYLDNNLYIMFHDGTIDHGVFIASSDVPNWQTKTQISVLWRRSSAIWNNDNIVINIDGKHIVPAGQFSETSWNSFTVDSNIYIGNDSGDTAAEANGIIERLDIYDEVLTENLIKSIKVNPNAMYY